MGNPLVSIIIPVYNTPVQYLNPCLNSVLGQDYQDIEVIIANDGSNTECATLLEYWKEKDSRISLHHLENGGVSRARNYAIDRALGEYLMFVDSDDVISKTWLKWSVNIAKEKKADVVFGTVRGISNAHDVPEQKSCKGEYYFLEENMIWKLQCGQFVKDMKKNDAVFEEQYHGNWGKLFKKETVGTERYSEDMYYGEDQLFNQQVLRHVKRAVYSTDVSYYLVLDRPGSATHSYDENHMKAIELFLNRVKEVLPDNDDVRNAFYLHVLSRADSQVFQTCRATQSGAVSIFQIRSWIRQAMSRPVFAEAARCADTSVLGAKSAFRMNLIKEHFIFAVSLWDKLYITRKYKNA